MLIKISLAFFCVLHLAQANDAQVNIQQPELLAQYHQKYEELLKAKQVWPSQIQTVKEELSVHLANYQKLKTELSGKEASLNSAKQNYEDQAQHLNFLKNIEGVANNQKLATRTRAVQAGEFGRIEDVSIESLEQKAGGLNAEIDSLSNQINEKQNEINEIERTNPVYLDLVTNLRALNSRIGDEESNLSSINSRIATAQSRVSGLEDDLERSIEAERSARQRVIEINDREIPRLERDEDELSDELRELRTELKNKKERRRTVRKNKKDTEKQIAKKEKEKEEDGADVEAINKEIRELKKKLSRQTDRLNRLNDEIDGFNGLERQVTRKEDDLEDIEEEIDDLKDLAIEKRSEAGREAINQIEYQDDIDDLETELSRLERNKDSSEGALAELGRQKRAVNGDIARFRDENIRPIENIIAQLDSQRSGLISRARSLNSWRLSLIRQNNNITQSKEKIPNQTRIAEQARSDYEALKESLASDFAMLDQLKNNYNQAATAHNNLSKEISTRIEEFFNLEKQVLNNNEVNNVQ